MADHITDWRLALSKIFLINTLNVKVQCTWIYCKWGESIWNFTISIYQPKHTLLWSRSTTIFFLCFLIDLQNSLVKHDCFYFCKSQSIFIPLLSTTSMFFIFLKGYIAVFFVFLWSTLYAQVYTGNWTKW